MRQLKRCDPAHGVSGLCFPPWDIRAVSAAHMRMPKLLQKANEFPPWLHFCSAWAGSPAGTLLLRYLLSIKCLSSGSDALKGWMLLSR